MLRRLFLSFFAAMPLLSHAVDEPDHEVTRRLEGVELRRYAPYVVAEVVLDSTPEAAGGEAFPILAGYIFGKNKGEKKFAMTAPVTQAAAPSRIDTSTPVTQVAVAGGIRVQFILPKGVTMASAPEPFDPRVQLRQIAGEPLGGDPLLWHMVAGQLSRASGVAAPRGRRRGCRHAGRAGVGALRRAVHAVVHAAQRNLAAFAVIRATRRVPPTFNARARTARRVLSA